MRHLLPIFVLACTLTLGACAASNAPPRPEAGDAHSPLDDSAIAAACGDAQVHQRCMAAASAEGEMHFSCDCVARPSGADEAVLTITGTNEDDEAVDADFTLRWSDRAWQLGDMQIDRAR